MGAGMVEKMLYLKVLYGILRLGTKHALHIGNYTRHVWRQRQGAFVQPAIGWMS